MRENLTKRFPERKAKFCYVLDKTGKIIKVSELTQLNHYLERVMQSNENLDKFYPIETQRSKLSEAREKALESSKSPAKLRKDSLLERQITLGLIEREHARKSDSDAYLYFQIPPQV